MSPGPPWPRTAASKSLLPTHHPSSKRSGEHPEGIESPPPPAMAAGICHARSATRSLARHLYRSLQPRRAFAAAAVDYESELEEEYGYGLRGALEAAKDAWGEREGRGVRWVFMGSPAAQKHVYATRIADLLAVPHISMGTLVRQELDPSSSLYKKIANAVNEGKLVPEDIIFGLLSKRLEEGYQRGEMGFVLDGIPRTRIQAEILDQITDIDLIVNFKCVKECLVKKHFGSDICSNCGQSFDAGNSESASLNPCLATPNGHAWRETSMMKDVADARGEKFRIYSEQSKLLEEYYRKQKKLVDFPVSGGPRENWKGLLATLNLQHIAAASTSWKLTG